MVTTEITTNDCDHNDTTNTNHDPATFTNDNNYDD